jgi:hypothetical protein
MFPTGAISIAMYNPVTNTLAAGPTVSASYIGGVLIPDGRIVLVPYGGPNIGLYLTNTPAPAEFCLHPFFNKL